ncbi:MAG TPA: hypothetical protein V6C69_10050 [Trichormus sp.]|jgi:hypothetical protein
MRSKEKEKAVELKCAGECERTPDVDGAAPASRDCAGSSDVATGSEVMGSEPGSAGTANVETGGTGTASTETGNIQAESWAAESAETGSPGAAMPDQRPHFPAPTGSARLKWLTSAVMLCAIFAGAGVFLLKWRHEPAYKLTLQTSYIEMDEYHRVREAILLAQEAMRQAKHQHVAEKDLEPINAQLRYLYMQRYLDRQRQIHTPHQYAFGGRYRKYYGAHGHGSSASHFANIAPQKPASAAK